MIEVGISREIRKEYTFHDTQPGFQHKTGTETAIVRHIATAKEMPYTAISDLKAAYDTIPRKTLMELLRKRLSNNLASAITLTLQYLTVCTREDDTNTTGRISEGLKQRSPLSPTMFNIYMDTLAESLEESEKEQKQKLKTTRDQASTEMLADDVKIQARTEQALKKALEVSSSWAQTYGMRWGFKKNSIS